MARHVKPMMTTVQDKCVRMVAPVLMKLASRTVFVVLAKQEQTAVKVGVHCSLTNNVLGNDNTEQKGRYLTPKTIVCHNLYTTHNNSF